jgi:hypothetical protein
VRKLAYTTKVPLGFVDYRVQIIALVETTMEQNQEGPPMTVANLVQKVRHAIRPSSSPAKETVSDKLARYRTASKSMSHDQRGTDAEVNNDAVKHYKGWQDLRKQANRKA